MPQCGVRVQAALWRGRQYVSDRDRAGSPAGFTFLLGDSSPGAESPEERMEIFKAGGGQFYADVRDINVHERGGHFGPYENPEAWIHDLRATYRTLR